MPGRGRPPKRAEERHNRNRSITSALEVRNADVVDELAFEPPACPARIDGERLASEVEDVWGAYWNDGVSKALAGPDGIERVGVVTRWIRLVDEEHRLALEILKAGNTVEGSQGQLRPHPLWGIVNQIREDIHKAETVLGLTPIDRARLGITAATGQLTAAVVNERLNRMAQAAAPPEVVVLDDLRVPDLRKIARDRFGLKGVSRLARKALLDAIEAAAS